MRFKFVLRLLGDNDEILAWREIIGEPRTDHPGAASAPIFGVEGRVFSMVGFADGFVRKANLHWCDMNVARDIARQWPEDARVTRGQLIEFLLIEPLWMIPGEHGIPLPAVTVDSNVTIGTKPGMLGANV